MSKEILTLNTTTTSLRIAKAGRSWITKARRDIATHNPSY
jgi:hypothetical protein